MKKIILAFVLAGMVQGNVYAQGNSVHPVKTPAKLITLKTGISMEYVEQGQYDGTTVVLIHGFTDSWHSYESVLPFLPSYLHVYALTMRGHGNSTKPLSGYHPKDFAADISEFICEMKLGSAVIVGHSMGGVIAQQFAKDYPKMARALVIIDSDAAFKENPDLNEFFKEVSRLTDPVPFEFADAFQRSTIINPVDTSYYDVLVNETLKVPAHVWKAVGKGLTEVDFVKDGPVKYKRPVLLFWGDKDFICPMPAQERLRQVFPRSKLMVYAETGHALHWERPELFAKDLVSFIDKIDYK